MRSQIDMSARGSLSRKVAVRFCGPTAVQPRCNRGALYPPYPLQYPAMSRTLNPAEQRSAASERRRQSAAPLLGQTPHRMGLALEIDDVVPEALHRRIGWDIRHHFMAEKIVVRFGLQLPRDRELVRQLAIVYVLGGLHTP